MAEYKNKHNNVLPGIFKIFLNLIEALTYFFGVGNQVFFF